MNKTVLIAGGCSLVGVAVGGVGGYFLARHRFYATIGDLISIELDKAKKMHAIQLMQAREKPASPTDIIISFEEDEPALVVEGEDDAEALPEPTPETVEEANAALTDYRGIGRRVLEEKPPIEEVVQQHNIFADTPRPKKSLPAREPGTGKFMPKQAVPTERAPDEPYMISHEEFFENEPDHEQETLLYFVNDNTLVVKADYQETVEIERVGEVHLTLFPEAGPGLVRSIAVRNEQQHMDYDIELAEGSLTEALGLGDDEDAAAYL